MEFCSQHGYDILYGDTDSVFIRPKTDDTTSGISTLLNSFHNYLKVCYGNAVGITSFIRVCESCGFASAPQREPRLTTLADLVYIKLHYRY